MSYGQTGWPRFHKTSSCGNYVTKILLDMQSMSCRASLVEHFSLTSAQLDNKLWHCFIMTGILINFRNLSEMKHIWECYTHNKTTTSGTPISTFMTRNFDFLLLTVSSRPIFKWVGLTCSNFRTYKCGKGFKGDPIFYSQRAIQKFADNILKYLLWFFRENQAYFSFKLSSRWFIWNIWQVFLCEVKQKYFRMLSAV